MGTASNQGNFWSSNIATSPSSPGGTDIVLDSETIGDLPIGRYPDMIGATPTVAGAKGAVPQPTSGEDDEFLRGDATWAVPAGGGSLPVVDSTSIAEGSVDNTKEVRFEVDTLLTTGTTRVITVPDKNVTLDDIADTRDPNTHAANHQNGGSDEIATATPAANAIPKADGSSLLDPWISTSSETVDGLIEIATQAEVNTGSDDTRAVTPLKLTNFPGLLFGTEYDTLEATAAVFVSGPGFTQYLKLTTASIPAGDYLIAWMFVWNTTIKSSRIQVRVQVDDTTDLINPSDTGVFTANLPFDGTDPRLKESGYRVVTLTAATHDIDLDWEQVGTSGVATIYQGSVTIWRVA